MKHFRLLPSRASHDWSLSPFLPLLYLHRFCSLAELLPLGRYAKYYGVMTCSNALPFLFASLLPFLRCSALLFQFALRSRSHWPAIARSNWPTRSRRHLHCGDGRGGQRFARQSELRQIGLQTGQDRSSIVSRSLFSILAQCPKRAVFTDHEWLRYLALIWVYHFLE